MSKRATVDTTETRLTPEEEADLQAMNAEQPEPVEAEVEEQEDDEEDEQPEGEQQEGEQPAERAFDEEGQAVIPGTEPEEEGATAQEPRSRSDIEYDFRMAVFSGQIKKVTEDWKAGRKLNVMIESGDRARLSKGLEKFSAADELVFRVLPERPHFKDKEPEEFGTKVPTFGVSMIERLERKAFEEGFNGWQEMSELDVYQKICDTIHKIGGEVNDPENMNDADVQKSAVDLANFAFFLWWNSKAKSGKAGQ